MVKRRNSKQRELENHRSGFGWCGSFGPLRWPREWLAVSTRTVLAGCKAFPSIDYRALCVPIASADARPACAAEPWKTETTHALRGIATGLWGVVNGRRTASGERFDMYAMTACHPTLPFARGRV